jgi:hypothetical protein
MLQLRGGLNFPEEPLDTHPLRQFPMHHFDRDLAVVAGVVGEINVCHPARFPELAAAWTPGGLQPAPEYTTCASGVHALAIVSLSVKTASLNRSADRDAAY